MRVTCTLHEVLRAALARLIGGMKASTSTAWTNESFANFQGEGIVFVRFAVIGLQHRLDDSG